MKAMLRIGRAAQAGRRSLAGERSARGGRLLLGLVTACWLAGLAAGAAKAEVGFFTPRGAPQALAGKVQFVKINVSSPDQLESSLRMAQAGGLRLRLDMGPVVTTPMPSGRVGRHYVTRDDGRRHDKLLPPDADNKLRQFPDDVRLRAILAPYLERVAAYPAVVDRVFLADEPYLNGISRQEMERAGRVTREELDRRGLRHVRLGVVFAAGMFNAEFARMVDDASVRYVRQLDDHYRAPNEDQAGHEAWKRQIQRVRLATYDRAGNMYLGGGFPAGFDLVAFDFYLSTILLDGVHEHTLDWLAKHYPKAGCASFAGQSMTQVRQTLTFFRDGPVTQQPDAQTSDRRMLNQIFDCRMNAVTEMLLKERGNRPIELMLIAESGNNGVLEFDARQQVEPDQPPLLVEARVLDEVRRAECFYVRHQRSYRGLMFFTFENEYDNTIRLHVGGAAGMPTVLSSIFNFAGAWQDGKSLSKLPSHCTIAPQRR